MINNVEWDGILFEADDGVVSMRASWEGIECKLSMSCVDVEEVNMLIEVLKKFRSTLK